MNYEKELKKEYGVYAGDYSLSMFKGIKAAEKYGNGILEKVASRAKQGKYFWYILNRDILLSIDEGKPVLEKVNVVSRRENSYGQIICHLDMRRYL